jgi:hypothetical protein
MRSRQFQMPGHRSPRDIAAMGRQQAAQQRWRNAFISVCVVGAALYALVSPIAG